MRRTAAPVVLLAAALLAAAPRRAAGSSADWIASERITLKTTDLKPADKPDPKLDKALPREFDGGTPYSLYWFDLDGDGAPEAIVYVRAPEYCGSGGCSLVIFRAGKNGDYETLADIGGVHPPFVVSSERKTNGWRDLFILSRGEVPGESGFHQLKFDGRSYPKAAMVGEYVKPGAVLDGVKLVDGPELAVPAAAADTHAERIESERITLKTTDLKPADKPDPKLETALRRRLHGAKAYALYWYDLDGNGTPEAIVDVHDPAFCGPGGCSLFIFRRAQSGDYEKVSHIVGVHPPVVISGRRKTNGWRDLFIVSRGPTEDDSGFYQLKFDGKSYPEGASSGEYVGPGAVLHGTKLVDGTELNMPASPPPAKTP